MEAIRRELVHNDMVISVWFNAWRYEREEHMNRAVLDTLREGLAESRESEDGSGSEELGHARRAAATEPPSDRLRRTTANKPVELGGR